MSTTLPDASPANANAREMYQIQLKARVCFATLQKRWREIDRLGPTSGTIAVMKMVKLFPTSRVRNHSKSSRAGPITRAVLSGDGWTGALQRQGVATSNS